MKRKQTTFDLVAAHLLRQGQRSLERLGEIADCAYRGHDGLQCAAGCLIPDKEYKSTFEGKSAKGVACESTGGTFFGHDVNLVYELQQCHDYCPVVRWRRRLREIASDNKLDSSVLDRFYRKKGKWIERKAK